MQADGEKITSLLRTARGQLDGILKMVEDDRYCMDISHQLLATQAILKRANREILLVHINGCVREAFERVDENAKDEKIAEILSLINKL